MDDDKRGNNKDEEGRDRFDPDFSPQNVINRRAVQAHRLKYDSERNVYVDYDGCLIRDKFGQPL